MLLHSCRIEDLTRQAPEDIFEESVQHNVCFTLPMTFSLVVFGVVVPRVQRTTARSKHRVHREDTNGYNLGTSIVISSPCPSNSVSYISMDDRLFCSPSFLWYWDTRLEFSFLWRHFLVPSFWMDTGSNMCRSLSVLFHCHMPRQNSIARRCGST